MNYDALVFDAVRYRRNVGADLDSIRPYVGIREGEKRTSAHDAEALARLAKAGVVRQTGTRWFLTPAAYRQASGTALAPEWEAGDAWVLLALLYNQTNEHCKLEHVIATADGINHALPTLDEIYGALNRLEAGRLIRARRDTFTVTERALGLFAKVQAACKKSILDQLDCLGRLMKCPCCGVKLKAVRWRVQLDQAEFESAVASYTRRFS